MKKSRQKIIVVVGSNASGKSELGVKLAKKYNWEIISADSRQVYKGLDIGSGKITKKEMRGVPHHCIDIANPKKQFSAADFRDCAQSAICNILARCKTPIIVGGTGFYIDVALGRIKLAGVPPNNELRKKLSKKTAEQLLAMLKKLDPERAKTIEQKNPRRLIRAIEIVVGKPNLSHLAALPPSEIVWIGIKRSPEELKKRIHTRLQKRTTGIVKEIKSLRKNGLTWKRMDELGLEYRYFSYYVRGKITKEEMLEKLEREINKYAKRQMTWFKRNKKISWIKNEKEINKVLLNKNI
jgi:tRNA dimethylallyltransferase